MGSSPSEPAIASPEFLRVFTAQAGPSRRMPFSRFMNLALYDPRVGYYRRPRPRVGYTEGTDFFTASTSGPVFGELVAAGAAELIRRHGSEPETFAFVELGAEHPEGVLKGVAHPFASCRTLRLGEAVELSGACVVFSNELFDAQPFARYVRTATGWEEIYVRCDNDRLEEERVAVAPPPGLPASVPPGYAFDAPIAATELARELASRRWHGLFLAFDYGKSFAELSTEMPAGTARAYHRHRQSNDLLARPGEQDLTCHVCWDWIADALRQHAFEVDPLTAQEAFFIRQAGSLLARRVEEDAARLTRRKLSLMQLLHPAHLGQKFQVLSAWREAEDCPCTG